MFILWNYFTSASFVEKVFSYSLYLILPLFIHTQRKRQRFLFSLLCLNKGFSVTLSILKKHHRINLGHRQLVKVSKSSRKSPWTLLLAICTTVTKDSYYSIEWICIFYCKPVIFHAKTGHIDQEAFPLTHTHTMAWYGIDVFTGTVVGILYNCGSMKSPICKRILW